ncbi:DNA modification methylase [Microbacterium sp. GXF7504]
MKSRLIASLAVGAAVVLGTTGCGLIAPQSTTVQYQPSDGMNVPDSSGPLLVRNALIVSDDEGVDGNFIAAVVNATDDDHTLNLEIGEGSDAVKKTIRVSAGTTKSLGVEDIDGVENLEGAEPLLIEGLNVKPGATVSVYFQSGDGEGASVPIQVVDGTLEHLGELVP